MTSPVPARLALAGLFALCAPHAGAADWSPEIDRYYQAGFTADKLPTSVRATLAAIDDAPLPFKRFIYKQSADVRFTKGNSLSIASTVSVVAQGGALATVVSREESSEDYAAVQFELGYRGLLVLRDQKYFPNAPIVTKVYRKLPPDHSPIMEVRTLSLAPATPPTAARTATTFGFEVASTNDLAHPMRMLRTCLVGEDFEASTLDASLTGQARTIACDLFEPDGRTRDLHQEKVYLADYGVALLRKVVTASFVADYRISDVHLER